MSGKIPTDAYEQYLALGSERSYATLAERLGVSKQAITARAKREHWQERIDAIESEARERTDKKAVETLEELNDRWLRMWGAVEKKALEALRDKSIESAMDAVKALDLAQKNTRLIRGEPTERHEHIEAIIKREHARWLEPVPDDEDEEEDEPEQPPSDAALDDQQDRAVS